MTQKKKRIICTCVQDPFADLPPKVPRAKKPRPSSLRQVTCPGCGLVYWTNRETDVCIACEKRGFRADTARS